MGEVASFIILNYLLNCNKINDFNDRTRKVSIKKGSRCLSLMLCIAFIKKVVNMTNEERFKKYVEENCKNYDNRKSNLCDIRISYVNGIVKTYCAFYEREETKKNKKKFTYTTADKSRPLMKGLI